jgi:putative nucleotidyltransferase with HDIG domain
MNRKLLITAFAVCASLGAIPAFAHTTQFATGQAVASQAQPVLRLMNDREFSSFLERLDADLLRSRLQMKKMDVKSLTLDSQEKQELERSYARCLESLDGTRDEIQKLSQKQTLKLDLYLLIDLNELARNLDALDEVLLSPAAGSGTGGAQKSLGYAPWHRIESLMALASYAMDAAKSRGRRYPEPPHPYRNDLCARPRPRDSFAGIPAPGSKDAGFHDTRYSDHFRNRLTHTIEVAQIARTVAGALGLNTDLAEALALVHDIGHPPFGHAGERKLDELLRPHGERFDHNLQALRIVEQFEQRYLDFPGLNLTFEVREGIVKHSRDYDAGAVSGTVRVSARRAPAARSAADRFRR